MPYVSIQITSEPKATVEQKARVIRGVTDVLVRELGKDPEHTFVIIEEISVDNWGIGGESTRAWRQRTGR